MSSTRDNTMRARVATMSTCLLPNKPALMTAILSLASNLVRCVTARNSVSDAASAQWVQFLEPNNALHFIRQALFLLHKKKTELAYPRTTSPPPPALGNWWCGFASLGSSYVVWTLDKQRCQLTELLQLTRWHSYIILKQHIVYRCGLSVTSLSQQSMPATFIHTSIVKRGEHLQAPARSASHKISNEQQYLCKF